MTIILFLLNSQAVLLGAVSGLLLWFETVVPTLLPFMILSSILLQLHGESILSKFLSPFTTPVFGISPAGNYVLFIGLFCGYPLGAKTAATLIREKRLSVCEGQYLMNFCNNVSPIFTIGFICNSLLNEKSLIPAALLILYGIPLLLGILSRKIYFLPELSACSYKRADSQTHGSPMRIISVLDNSITEACSTALRLGGYMILFSALCSLTAHSRFIPYELKTLLALVLEVTSGCRTAVSSPILSSSSSLAYAALFSCAAFGGLAGLAQTAGIIENTGLSMKQYILFRAACSVSIFIITFILF